MSATHPLQFVLNGMTVETEAAADERLLDLLRVRLGHTGTKEGCGQGECGACTVLIEERAVNACLVPALEVDGRHVRTIEGLGGPDGALSPVQRAFVEQHGTQCGFCTPGMIMSTVALLGENPDPTDEQIRGAVVGNLCRCTGYVQIIASVRKAAALIAEEGSA